MKSKKSTKRKKATRNTNTSKDKLSLGDQIFLIYNFVVGFVVYVYVEGKYQYIMRPKERTVKTGIMWLIISSISLGIYLLVKKIVKKVRERK